jgi:dolichol-phosphate mannosyltransferase
MTRPLVFVPTYNERENAENLCGQILGLGLDLDLLFIDDNSSDGTGEILDRLARAHPNVKVVHRPGKLGIGSAHQAGIAWAYDHGYAQLITMDCDFTHSPHHIPEFLATSAQGFDVVVGSRYMQKDSLPDWNLYRKTLTLTGHVLTKKLLRLPYDATGAYRCYRLTSIPRAAFDLVTSHGYSFFFESLYVLHRNDARIAEIPIVLPNRMYGHSKMTLAEIKRSVQLLVTTYLETVLSPQRFELPRAISAAPLEDEPARGRG